MIYSEKCTVEFFPDKKKILYMYFFFFLDLLQKHFWAIFYLQLFEHGITFFSLEVSEFFQYALRVLGR